MHKKLRESQGHYERAVADHNTFIREANEATERARLATNRVVAAAQEMEVKRQAMETAVNDVIRVGDITEEEQKIIIAKIMKD